MLSWPLTDLFVYVAIASRVTSSQLETSGEFPWLKAKLLESDKEQKR